MRTKNGKRIGPVPIALVAVLALAAFVSAGLLMTWNTSVAQAQDPGPSARATGSIADVELDVGEALAVNDNTSIDATVAFTTVGTATYSVVDDNDGDIEVRVSAAGVITIDAEDTLPEDTTAEVTVTVMAVANNETATASVKFDVMIVENPIEQNGTMVVNPTDWASTGSCDVATDGTDLTSRLGDHDDDTSNADTSFTLDDDDVLVSGGDCTTSDNSVEVSFTNSGNAAETHVIYVTGGSKFTKVVPVVAEEGLDEHLLEVPIGTLGRSGEATIDVRRSMADDDGLVYVIGYANQMDANNRINKATTFPSNAEFVVEVRFLNPPSAGDDKSRIALVDSDGEAIAEVPSGEEEATVMITVTDDNKQPLPGTRTTFTIEDAPDTVVFKETVEQRFRTSVDADGTKMVTISGLPEEDPFRYTVKAALDNGPTVEKKVIRMGEPTTATVSGYEICDPGKCKADDLVLAPGDSFFVVAKAMDSAGNNVSKDNFDSIEGAEDADQDVLTAITGNAETEIWWNSLDCAAMAKYDPQGRRANDDNPYCRDYVGLADAEEAVVNGLDVPDYFAAFMVDGEADIGTYTVEATTDNDVTASVMITVSGDASMMSVACDPVIIPIATGLTDCTIMVTDDNGNPPSNLHLDDGDDDTDDTDMARIAVRSREVTLIGAAQNDIELDKKGMAMFSVLLREDAAEGSSITINVSSTIDGEPLQASTTVTYGESDGTTDPGMDGELGTVTDVITGFNRGGALQVSWTKAANASGYIIIAINVNDVNDDVIAVVLNDGDLDTQNISGLTPGATYDIYVAATASGGRNTLSDAARVTAQ